jgi:hypothetical protein
MLERRKSPKACEIVAALIKRSIPHEIANIPVKLEACMVEIPAVLYADQIWDF